MQQFELVCDRAILRPTIQSAVMLGSALGVVLWGTMSDSFGRRRTINICVVLSFPIGIAIAYAPTYVTFVGLRFLHAFMSSIGVVCFAMVMEVRCRIFNILYDACSADSLHCN